MPNGGPTGAGWTFLTNHAHVLITIARDREVLMRDVAAEVGITERAVQHIVAELVEAGYLTRHRVGRRNHYEVHADLPLRHPVEGGHLVADLLSALERPGDDDAPGARGSTAP